MCEKEEGGERNVLIEAATGLSGAAFFIFSAKYENELSLEIAKDAIDAIMSNLKLVNEQK